MGLIKTVISKIKGESIHDKIKSHILNFHKGDKYRNFLKIKEFNDNGVTVNDRIAYIGYVLEKMDITFKSYEDLGILYEDSTGYKYLYVQDITDNTTLTLPLHETVNPLTLDVIFVTDGGHTNLGMIVWGNIIGLYSSYAYKSITNNTQVDFSIRLAVVPILVNCLKTSYRTSDLVIDGNVIDILTKVEGRDLSISLVVDKPVDGECKVRLISTYR